MIFTFNRHSIVQKKVLLAVPFLFITAPSSFLALRFRYFKLQTHCFQGLVTWQLLHYFLNSLQELPPEYSLNLSLGLVFQDQYQILFQNQNPHLFGEEREINVSSQETEQLVSLVLTFDCYFLQNQKKAHVDFVEHYQNLKLKQMLTFPFLLKTFSSFAMLCSLLRSLLW